MRDKPKGISFCAIYEPDQQKMMHALKILLNYQPKRESINQKVEDSKSA